VQLLASQLLSLEASRNINPQPDKAKNSTKYAVVYWIETKNVMLLTRIRKDKREKKASVILKAEHRERETKIVKIGGWLTEYLDDVLSNFPMGGRELFYRSVVSFICLLSCATIS